MSFKESLAPHVRKTNSVRHMMLDVLLALLFAMVLPIVFYGFRVAVLVGVTALACVVSEAFFCLFARKEITVTDFSPLVTGGIIALLMPVNIPLWVPVVAGAFAILVVKMPFGGTGRSPFNPAAAGVVFITLCFPEHVFGYAGDLIGKRLPLFESIDFAPAASPAAILKEGLRPEYLREDLLLGLFPGPVGATCVIVLLACGFYLFVRRTANFDTPLCYLGAAAVYAALFPRIVGTRGESVFFELIAGPLVFCAVFLLTEPSTSPRTRVGRCIYGALGGIITMLFRHFGVYEQGACFAVLLINTMTPSLDRLSWTIKQMGGKLFAKR